MHNIAVQSRNDRLVLFAILLVLCFVFSILLSACSSAEEEALAPTDTSVPPTATSASPTVTSEPPTPTTAATSCNEVEGVCLWLSFDGKSCTYEGPTELKPGPVTLLFINKSDAIAFVNLVRHTSDKTIQDMIDYTERVPPRPNRPAWSSEVGAYGGALQGNSYTWEGVLEPGIHTMTCAKPMPFDDYFGAGVTVED